MKLKRIGLFLLAGRLLFGVNCGTSEEAVPVAKTEPPPTAVTNGPCLSAVPQAFEFRRFRTVPAPGMTAAPTIDQLRHSERERRLKEEQAQQRSALEQWHQRELQNPSRSLSPLDLQQNHQAEHRAFLDQLHREDELIESRTQEQYNPVPDEVEQTLAPRSRIGACRSVRDHQ